MLHRLFASSLFAFPLAFVFALALALGACGGPTTEPTPESSKETAKEITKEAIPEDGSPEPSAPCTLLSDFGKPCTDGLGPCLANGKKVCSPDGQTLVCDAIAQKQLSKPEVCNGIDDDCDGVIDNSPIDQNRPCKVPGAQGPCADAVTVCKGGFPECPAAVQPSAEICDNKDNDCDGQIDNGVTRPCFTGPAGTQGVGSCKDGIEACVAGKWSGTCQNEVKPVTEICDGLDNNCDGKIDESFPQQGQRCTVPGANGACATSTSSCDNGKLVCVQNIQPIAETCDRIDNDCDGQIDNGVTRPCYTGPNGTSGIGLCKAGTQTCTNGAFGTCQNEVKPVTEICDGLDNNCDGKIDESFSQQGQRCTVPGAKGPCATSTFVCTQGKVECPQVVQPATEICNNLDDDCDGQIDNGVTRPCYGGPNGTPGVGLCKAGTQTCTSGSFGTCQGEVRPATEACDGLDNNCDGKIDETFPQQGQRCNVPGANGICVPSIYACTNGVLSCPQTVQPNVEACNNLDDDCDGQIDDGVTRPCYTGTAGTNGVGECKEGIQVCSSGSFGTCQNQTVPTAEICDGKDNDCDGQIDETFPTANQVCTIPGLSGPCASSRLVCNNGQIQCPQTVQPTTEICFNSIDENCDGRPDEGCFRMAITNVDDIFVILIAPSDNPAPTDFVERARLTRGQTNNSLNLTAFLASGKNTIRIQVINNSGVYTYTYSLFEGATQIDTASCGTINVIGCNNNDTATGTVYTKDYIVTKP